MQVYAGRYSNVVHPQNPLAQGALRFESMDSGETYEIIRKIVALWKNTGVANDYMVYAKAVTGKQVIWEVVPFPKTGWKFIGIWNQIKVLWNVTFGSKTQNQQAQQTWNKFYQEHKADFQIALDPVGDSNQRGTDNFCEQTTSAKQSVHEGDKIRILHDYAPLLGKDKPHLLLMPKAHRPTFDELTKEEFVEIAEKTNLLVDHYLKNGFEAVYLYIKCGVLAGQTQPHLHEHLIPTVSKAEAFFGKLIVLKKLLLPFLASKLSPQELSARVTQTYRELQPVLSK